MGEYYPTRFASEFGWESWPTYPTMSQFLPEDQQYFMSPLMQNRQKLNNGQEAMIKELLNHYNLPKGWNQTGDGYKYMLYAVNYMQAYCTKVQVEYYRSLRYSCLTLKNGKKQHGCTMGEMYWQTNDFWPGSSWSSIDILNRYKMIQYYANNFYAKLSIIGYNNNTHYTFWIINDYVNKSFQNCGLQLNSYSYIDGQMNKWQIPGITVETESAAMVYAISNADFLGQSKCVNLSDCILEMSLFDGCPSTDNWMFIGSPNNTKANDPQLKIMDVVGVDGVMGEFNITFNSKAVAVFVWLETIVDGYFSDNGMFVLPGDSWVIFYARDEKTNSSVLEQSLDIYSLYEAGGFMNG